MVMRKTFGERLFDVFNYALMGLVALVCLYPLWHVLCGSFSNPLIYNKHSGPILLPLGFSLRGYANVFRNPNIWIGYQNTLFYVGVGTLVRMFLTILGAYVLSEKNFMLRKPLTVGIVFTMYFSGGLIPDYLLVNALGLLNTRWALIYPLAITTWNLIILKTAFQGIPDSLVESARLDGANEMTTLFRIVLPVAKATIAVITLYYVVAEWNSWFKAAIYLPGKREYFPLQLVLRELLITDLTSSGSAISIDSGMLNLEDLLLRDIMRYATICVSTLPIVAAYPFAQKYFVKGVMMGSVKG